MKSILLKGTKDAGKSTTLREVCKRLKPTKVYKLNTSDGKIELSGIDNIFNETYIIEVQGKWIVVVAGAPTEQNRRITIIIEICIKIKTDISFLLVSMRSFEKRKGFKTQEELDSKSEILLSEIICKIDDDDFMNTTEWNHRVDKIVEIVKSNI